MTAKIQKVLKLMLICNDCIAEWQFLYLETILLNSMAQLCQIASI